MNKLIDRLLIVCNIGITAVLFYLFAYQSELLVHSVDESYRGLVEISVLIYLFVAIFIHTILHEGGHLIAGLLSGYEYVSFRIGSFVWIKGADNKLHLKKMKIKGTAGQCLMSPPQVPTEECSYVWYHLGGGLVNLVLGLLGVLLYHFVLPHNIVTLLLCEVFGIIGLVLAVTNLLPNKAGGIQNDGYNIIDLGKNLEAKRYMNLVLSANAFLTVAETYSDVPKAVVEEIKALDHTKMDLTQVSAVNAINYQASFCFANGEYDRAYEISKAIIETKGALELFKDEARCECLFYELTHDMDQEKIEALYNKKLQKYIKATALYPSRQRLMVAYYMLYLKDEKKAREAYNKLKKSVQTFMIKADALLELEIATRIIEGDLNRGSDAISL